MSHTQNRWTQDTPQPDGQLFLTANNFAMIGTQSPLTTAGAGLLTLNQAQSLTTSYWADINQMLRTGVLATPNLSQEQFGTAASQPGPSSVSGTSGPLGINGFPPFTGAQLPTLSSGQVSGAKGKGLQINWVDMVYEVDTLALTSATFTLNKTVMPAAGASAAPVVTAIPVTGTLPLVTNTAGQVTRSRITVTTPAMITADGTSLIAELILVTPATSTVKFYGMIFGVSFNFN